MKLSFGAYGERRGSTWTGSPSAGDLATIGNTSRHGFTGHEHLDAVGLIHMNGRVYDPVVGRFLSRDPIVSSMCSTQAINGYAYVKNNPLSRIDPSGYSDGPCLGGACKKYTGDTRLPEIEVTAEREYSALGAGGFGGWGAGGGGGSGFEPASLEDGSWEALAEDGTTETTETALDEVVVTAESFQIGIVPGPWGLTATASPPDVMETLPDEAAMKQATCLKTCSAIGSALSDLAGSSAAGLVAGLQVSGGNLAVGGVGALAGLATGLATLSAQPGPNGNWGQVATAATAGGLAGGATLLAAGGGFTGTSGGIAGGLVSGAFATAGMPAPLSSAIGNGIGSLGMPGNSWAQIGRNLTVGLRHGFVAGFVGIGVAELGRATTSLVCNQLCRQ